MNDIEINPQEVEEIESENNINCFKIAVKS